jgi:hypothetical protein
MRAGEVGRDGRRDKPGDDGCDSNRPATTLGSGPTPSTPSTGMMTLIYSNPTSTSYIAPMPARVVVPAAGAGTANEIADGPEIQILVFPPTYRGPGGATGSGRSPQSGRSIGSGLWPLRWRTPHDMGRCHRIIGEFFHRFRWVNRWAGRRPPPLTRQRLAHSVRRTGRQVVSVGRGGADHCADYPGDQQLQSQVICHGRSSAIIFLKAYSKAAGPAMHNRRVLVHVPVRSSSSRPYGCCSLSPLTIKAVL